MKNHPRHKFIKDSVEIKEVDIHDRYQKRGLRRVTTFLCECGQTQLFHELPTDMEMVVNYYFG